MPGQDVEAAVGLDVQEDDGHQHQQRAEQRVQEELERRVDAVRAAPDADDDVHRDQRGFEERVEQQAVEGREHADHQARQDQERTHVLVHALGDHFPAGDHDDHGDEGRQQHEPDGDAVHAQVVGRVEALDPGQLGLELHADLGIVEAGDQRDRDQERRDGRDEGEPADHAHVVVASDRQQHHPCQDRQPDGKTQETHCCSPPALISERRSGARYGDKARAARSSDRTPPGSSPARTSRGGRSV